MHKTSILIISLLFPISSFATASFLWLLETPPLTTSELWQNHGGNGGNGGHGGSGGSGGNGGNGGNGH